jgi:hypothetical protein
VAVETRLDLRDWQLCSTAEALTALVSRLDAVITTRLHGLVLALHAGLPALAVDPVAGGGKVTAQARAWGWPAIVAAEQAADRRLLGRHWDWCLSGPGRRAAACAARSGSAQQAAMLAGLVAELRPAGDREPG